MKNTSTNRPLLIGLSFIATVVLTGCPSSREGSGTGGGHGPANVTNATSHDTSGTGGGHPPSNLTSHDSSGTGGGHRPTKIKRDTTIIR